jgi:hypothetical protein
MGSHLGEMCCRPLFDSIVPGVLSLRANAVFLAPCPARS